MRVLHPLAGQITARSLDGSPIHSPDSTSPKEQT